MAPWFRRLARAVRRLFRLAPKLRSVQFRYEKDDLTVADEPIPWNAEAVFVEAVVEHTAVAPSKSDFRLSLAGHGSARPVALQPEAGGVFRLLFRLDPPQRPGLLQLFWRSRSLGQLELPYLSAEHFLRNLRLESPTVFACLGGQHVACEALVEGQDAAVSACGLLKSPTSLLPLVGLDLSVEWTGPDPGRTWRVPVPLSAPQVVPRQAVVSVPGAGRIDVPGTWHLRWTVAGRPLAQTDLHMISREEFSQSLYVPEHCRVCQQPDGAPGPPARGPCGPNTLTFCFRAASRESGLAALCPFEVAVRFTNPSRPPERAGKEVLVTDHPALGRTVDITVDSYHEVEAFDLYGGGRFLASVAWVPTPVASFTSEGGYRAPPDFPWTPAAEAALHERLSRLLGTEPEEPPVLPAGRPRIGTGAW